MPSRWTSRIITEMAGNPLLAGLPPMHPGEMLREITLPALAFSKAEIARRLRISEGTVRRHISSLVTKLGWVRSGA